MHEPTDSTSIDEGLDFECFDDAQGADDLDFCVMALETLAEKAPNEADRNSLLRGSRFLAREVRSVCLLLATQAAPRDPDSQRAALAAAASELSRGLRRR